MKKALFLVGLLSLSFSSFATTPQEAKAQWDNLSPQQQEVLKMQAQRKAQEAQSQWNNLTPEQQAAKKQEVMTQAQPYMEQARSQAATVRSNVQSRTGRR